MATLAKLQTLREQLIESRFTGIREFEDQNGERVVYRSDAEIATAIIAINRLIQEQDRRPISSIVFRTSKGLY